MKKVRFAIISILVILALGSSVVYADDNKITITKELAGNNDTTRYIRITKKVVGIEDGAFAGLKSLNSISVDSDNQYFASCNGVLYNKDFTELICVPQNMSNLQLKKTVKSYWSHALDGLPQDKRNKVVAFFGGNITNPNNPAKKIAQDKPQSDINASNKQNNSATYLSVDFSIYVYTNSNGRKCFNYTGPEVSRIIVPEGVEEIESFVANKTKLNTTTTYIKLPNSLKVMNNWAMFGYSDGDINMYNCLYSCTNLKKVEGGGNYYKGNGNYVLRADNSTCWSSTRRVPYRRFTRSIS